jgi:aryl-alcohol dehydrogenase-like predicted oxidoreductase
MYVCQAHCETREADGLVTPGLTLGDRVRGDPVKEIMQTAFENGINMFDTAEGYAAGQSEIDMCVAWPRRDSALT